MGGRFFQPHCRRRVLRVLGVALAALLLAYGAHAKGVTMSALEKVECPGGRLLSEPGKGMFNARCGYLVLPESADGAGRKIKIAILVLMPKETARWNAAPTVVVHGGPGVGIVGSWLGLAFSGFADNGPLVLFDQRGVGESTPHLCESLETYDSAADALTDEQSRAELTKKMQACIDELAKQKADLNAYGTDATVRDMEAIRTALDIDKWNVYGVSYGTTVSLAYLAAHPDRIRAAVLDSLYPPEMPGLSSGFADFSRSLDIMNASCAAQPPCRAHFGDLGAALDDAVKSLDGAPLQLPASAYSDAEGASISGATFLAVVNSQMIAINSWYVMPLAIHQVRKRESSELIARLYRDTLSEASIGVWFATECRERVPFDTRPTAPEKPRWPNLWKAAGVDLFFSLCDMWPAKRAANWETPRDVNVPTLVIAGEWDPVTPPRYAIETAKRLGARAQLLVVPNTAHSSTSLDACIGGVAAEFLADPARPIEPCAKRPEPVFATALVNPDWRSLGRALSPLGMSNAIWLALFAVLGFVSTIAWGLARIGLAFRSRGAREDPFWQRSSFWLSASIVALFAWWWSLITAWYGPDDVPYSYDYGVPVDVWIGASIIVVAALFGVVGVAQFFGEMRRRQVTVVRLAHRLWVIFALGATFFVLWAAEMLPHSPEPIVKDARYLFTLANEAVAQLLSQ